MKLLNFIAISFGSFIPTLTGGVTVTSGGCEWYKIGKLVFITCAIWIDSTAATADDFKITNAPFVASSQRAYGTVGYFYNMIAYSGICVSINVGTTTLDIVYGTSAGTIRIKGNQVSSAIQFSICYLTDE